MNLLKNITKILYPLTTQKNLYIKIDSQIDNVTIVSDPNRIR